MCAAGVGAPKGYPGCAPSAPVARALTLLVTLLAVSAALAGCAEDANDPGTGGTPTGTTPTGTTPPTGGTPPAGGTTPTGTTPGGGEARTCADVTAPAQNPVWVLETTMGTMRVTLFCDKTPLTAQHFVNLTGTGYFDGIKFHRVIKDFMNQGGDPLTKDDAKRASWGTGGPGYTIKDEFYCADGTVSYTHPATCPKGLGLKHDTPGVLSMANTGRPQTGGSQFFLTAAATPWLDGKHAVFGHTADQASLDVLLAINKVPTGQGDRPVTPVVINKATISWD